MAITSEVVLQKNPVFWKIRSPVQKSPKSGSQLRSFAMSIKWSQLEMMNANDLLSYCAKRKNNRIKIALVVWRYLLKSDDTFRTFIQNLRKWHFFHAKCVYISVKFICNFKNYTQNIFIPTVVWDKIRTTQI